MKSDGVEVDFDRLIQGLQDAKNEQEPLLSNEEMRSLIAERREKANQARKQKLMEIRAENAEEAATFLEENGQKEGVKITESGLQPSSLDRCIRLCTEKPEMFFRFKLVFKPFRVNPYV